MEAVDGIPVSGKGGKPVMEKVGVEHASSRPQSYGQDSHKDPVVPFVLALTMSHILLPLGDLCCCSWEVFLWPTLRMVPLPSWVEHPV